MGGLTSGFTSGLSAFGGSGGGGMPMGGGGGSKPGGNSMGSLGGYDWSLGLPLTKETATTYGGAKPGKAPTMKQPTPPDPYKIIATQANASNPNQIGPLGSTIYTGDPTTGNYTQTRTFSPELQNLYNQRLGMVSGDIPTPSNDFTDLSKQAQEANYAQQTSMLDPQWQKQKNEFDSQMANQGIMPGSEAYRTAYDDFNRSKQLAYNTAQQSAIGAGNQRQNELFSQSNTGFNQNLARRSQLYNELASLIGTQQIAGPKNVDATDPFNTQYMGNVNSVNAANANAASRNSQTTSAAASGMTALLAALLA